MLPKLLVIEDNADIARLVKFHLAELPASVTVAADGLAGMAAAEREPYGAIVLDVTLPGMSGFEILERLRAQGNRVPVLVLSGNLGDLPARLAALAPVDCLAKPFGVTELAARVKAMLRDDTAPAPAASLITAGTLTIDPVARTVQLDGRAVELAAKELDLLIELARHPGKVFTRRELLATVWGGAGDAGEHVVTAHIQRLRSKLERNAETPEWIQSGPTGGYGFMLSDLGGTGRT